ncbi:AAA family ATPase [Phytoactinopolyspora mesophila]|uniref:Chromosome partitioning protein n=1 Tax=Phytoactinopolyspora mesophila TaxID=2650750 RepID=A0A7K3M5R4_9ACTN|nr:chromosome partitioning protein [Phytoactinopolyspora mesophila]NDL58585.1 chromosome partitioning protein [Phytoactinopolyspora mesophila]
MSQLQVLIAVSGAGWDSSLVKTLEIAPGRIGVARRCVDLADLMAVAGAGLGQVALVSADLRRLDREAISSLRLNRLAVVGVLPSGESTADAARLAQLGVRHRVRVDADPGQLAEVILTAATESQADLGGAEKAAIANGPAGIEDAIRSGGAVRPADEDASAVDFVEGSGQRGRLLAVWGTCGAPGRTTLAVNLAMEFSLLGRATMLADADTYGASVAQVLGLLDEAPGLAGAARLANNGQLDAISLARYARRITPKLHVLTGVVRSSRWTELRPSALEMVWEQTRSVAAMTVVDCGFCLEDDESISFDSAAPRRNGATLSTLQAADVVVAVGSGDPVGLGRLVRGLSDLAEVAPEATVHVVVNRVRRSVAGADPEQQISAALNRYAGVKPFAFVPDAPQVLDAGLLSGLSLAEAAPRTPVRQAVAELSRRLLTADAATGRLGPARMRS